AKGAAEEEQRPVVGPPPQLAVGAGQAQRSVRHPGGEAIERERGVVLGLEAQGGVRGNRRVPGGEGEESVPANRARLGLLRGGAKGQGRAPRRGDPAAPG